jgi:hypothetical protein
MHPPKHPEFEVLLSPHELNRIHAKTARLAIKVARAHGIRINVPPKPKTAKTKRV